MNKPKIRNPKTDHLLTPENSALIIIDYQPKMINSVNSMSRVELLRNIVVIANAAKIYKIPTILSTVNVKGYKEADTLPVIKKATGDIKTYDRTTINAWEDEDFKAAVKATGRKKLIICALWTEACLSFPSLDAMAEGFEVYPIVDAVGGTSLLAHKTALKRITQAGAKPTTVVQVLCELQRDWARLDTVQDFLNMMYQAEIFMNTGK